MYKISIIIPVYNVENYIEETFNSILNQTLGFDYLEVIFVDDCSTDNSADILKQLEVKYDNVKYFSMDECCRSTGKPCNFGIEKSNADYLIFLNPTDVFINDACEKLYDCIVNDNLDIVLGNNVIQEGESLINNDWEYLNLNEGKLQISSIKENPNFLQPSLQIGNIIFKKRVIIENNIRFPEDMSRGETYFISFSLIKANGIQFINVPIIKNKLNSHLMYYKNDKCILSEYIKLYERLFNLYNDYDENLKWLSLVNLPKWLEMLIESNLHIKDKIDLLNYSSFLFEEFKKSQNLSYNKDYEFLYQKIYDKDYIGVLNESNVILSNNDPYHHIKSKKIFSVFFGFDLEIGGLAKAMFNRANILSNEGYDVTLLNIDEFINDDIFENFKNFKFIENFFKNSGFLNKNVDIINMFDYFSERNTINNQINFVSDDVNYMNSMLNNNLNLLNFNLKLPNNYFICKEYIIELIKTADQQIIFNYYYKSDFKDKIHSVYNFEKLIFIKDFCIDKNHLPIKSESYMDYSLVVETDYIDKKACLYTRDGFNYCTIYKTNNGLIYKLDDRYSFCSLKFDYKSFYEYFVSMVCLELDEKPFLISECPSHRPSISNISSDFVYKISMVHCNHHEEPFNCGSPIKSLAAFENLNDLDAIVFLTDSQKNDFIKEFEFKRAYVIPHFVSDKDLNESSGDKLEFNKNKVSIFARISPEKNMSDIIKAFKKVVDVKNDAILEIFGRALVSWEVSEYNNLTNLVTELGLEKNVFFRGHVEDVNSEMKDSLITLFTSDAEGFGLVILESMSNSTPVICYDLNYGPKYIISDNKDGILVEQYNIDELAEKIIELLNNPSRAIKMGELARQKIVENFSSKHILKKWEDLFLTIYNFRNSKHNQDEFGLDNSIIDDSDGVYQNNSSTIMGKFDDNLFKDGSNIINEKINEYLLLELESTSDKQKQLQIKQDIEINSIKKSVKYLTLETENLENVALDNNKKLELLINEIMHLKKYNNLEMNDDYWDDESYYHQRELYSKDLKDKNNEINFLIEKKNFLEMESKEKDNKVDSLKK